MSPAPLRLSGEGVDLSKRFFRYGTVDASPSASSETVIATLTIAADVAITQGIFLWGWAALTIGTSGTAANLRIRQTNTSGTVICATGATTQAATNLCERGCMGFDTAAVLPNQVYVLTLTVTSGAAASTVSALQLAALVL